MGEQANGALLLVGPLDRPAASNNILTTSVLGLTDSSMFRRRRVLADGVCFLGCLLPAAMVETVYLILRLQAAEKGYLIFWSRIL